MPRKHRHPNFRYLYNSYMKSEKWQRTRERRLIKDRHTCQACGQHGSIAGNPLHVHHMTYENLGNEKSRDLITFCKRCHEAWHRKNKAGRWKKGDEKPRQSKPRTRNVKKR